MAVLSLSRIKKIYPYNLQIIIISMLDLYMLKLIKNYSGDSFGVDMRSLLVQDLKFSSLGSDKHEFECQCFNLLAACHGELELCAQGSLSCEAHSWLTGCLYTAHHRWRTAGLMCALVITAPLFIHACDGYFGEIEATEYWIPVWILSYREQLLHYFVNFFPEMFGTEEIGAVTTNLLEYQMRQFSVSAEMCS